MAQINDIKKIFGDCVEAKGYTIFERCPLCGETWTFKLIGGVGLWDCAVCTKRLTDFKVLIDTLSQQYEWRDKLANIGKIDAPEGLVVLSEYVPEKSHHRIPSGISQLDRSIGGFEETMLTVLTGKRGDGKSTFASQLALAAVNEDVPVFFYSGELNKRTFFDWTYCQAAGHNWLVTIPDRFGEPRHHADEFSRGRISSWLGKRFILYDNTIVKSSEKNAILERCKIAVATYGCKIVFIDNLMTAKYAVNKEQDYYRAQSNFVGDLADFAQQYGTHVVLVAHPRKGEEGDLNDQVGGSGDITNRASNVIRIRRATDKEKAAEGCDSIVQITKNREFGRLGEINMRYEADSRRLVSMDGSSIDKYKWEEGV
jgi:twinkle protein